MRKTFILFLSFAIFFTVEISAQELNPTEEIPTFMERNSNKKNELITAKSFRPFCETDPCPCEGAFTAIQVYWFGEDHVSIEVYRDGGLSDLLLSDGDVERGDLLTVDPGSPLGQYTYFRVVDGAGDVCITAIFTRCPSNSWPLALEEQIVLGKSFRDFIVYSITDEENNFYCTLDNADQDWHVGGNVVGETNNLLGTLNDRDVTIITNDTDRGIITRMGNFGFGPDFGPEPGETIPTDRLHVRGRTLLENTGNALALLGQDHVFVQFHPDNAPLLSRGFLGYLAPGSNILSLENTFADGDLQLATIRNILLSSSRVGVGLSSPASETKVHVLGDAIRLSTENPGLNLARFIELRTNDYLGLNAEEDDLFVRSADNNIILESQRVGIGTDNPATDTKVHVIGTRIRLSPVEGSPISLDLRTDGSMAGGGLDINAFNEDLFIRSLDGHHIFMNALSNDGKVGIGTTEVPDNDGGIDLSDYKLYVKGGILTEEVRVRTGWCDYVFEENYDLLPLEEVKSFIRENGHLPDTPTAEEVESGGLELGANATNQQLKIEEIFLHLIDLNDRVKALEKENAELKAQLNRNK